MKSLLILAEILLLIFGWLGLIWGIFCFLGGPDGKFGSIEAFYWSIGFLIPSGLMLFGRKKVKNIRLKLTN